MRISLRIQPQGGDSIDYTDYIESISIQQSADSIIQSELPSVDFVANISTVLPNEIKPGGFVYWGTEDKYIYASIAKITRAKHHTEIRAIKRPSKLGGWYRGILPISAASLELLYGYTLDSDLLGIGRTIYAENADDFILGFNGTTSKPAMVQFNLPRPWWGTGESIIHSYDIESIQLQTISEFDTAEAKDVAKYTIDYDDVIEDSDTTHNVDTTKVITSQIGDKIVVGAVEYESSVSWSQAPDELTFYTCPHADMYAVGILSGTGTSQTMHLIMSNGAEYDVKGKVGGIAEDYYIHCYQSGANSYVLRAVKYDGTVLDSQSVASLVTGGSNHIIDEVIGYNTIERKQAQPGMNFNYYDIFSFGRPASVSGEYALGVACYTDLDGQFHMSLAKTADDLSGHWLVEIGTYASLANTKYYSISYDGTVTLDATANNTGSATVYELPNGLGYAPSATLTPKAMHKVNALSPLLHPPYDWQPYITADTTISYLWKTDSTTAIEKKGNLLLIRTYPIDTTIIRAEEISIKSGLDKTYAIFAPGYSLILNGSTTLTRRTISVYRDILPDSSYNRTQFETSTGRTGEESVQYLPMLLQPNSDFWKLVPTDKTRVSVQVNALKTTLTRGNSIKMHASSTASASTDLKLRYGNYSKLGHKYYIAVEVNAPAGMNSDYASFAIDNEAISKTSTKVAIDLTSIEATGSDWIKKSAICQAEAAGYCFPGACSRNADSDWYFRLPQIFDLTDAFGAGNEPDLDWCNNNLSVHDNILASYSFSVPEDWRFEDDNANYETSKVTARHLIDADDIIVPQIGCPVLYHREGAPEYSTTITTTGDWESRYFPVDVEAGKSYTLRFKYKVSGEYLPLAGYDSIPVQVLSSAPTNTDCKAIEIESIKLGTKAMNDYAEKIISFVPEVSKIYISYNVGYAQSGQDIDISFTDFVVSRTNSSENIIEEQYLSLSNWIDSHFGGDISVTEHNAGEEGIILGFRYMFEGSAQLWVDIMLLDDAQPWSNK